MAATPPPAVKQAAPFIKHIVLYGLGNATHPLTRHRCGLKPGRWVAQSCAWADSRLLCSAAAPDLLLPCRPSSVGQTAVTNLAKRLNLGPFAKDQKLSGELAEGRVPTPDHVRAATDGPEAVTVTLVKSSTSLSLNNVLCCIED